MSFSIPPSPPNFRGNTFNPVSYPSTTNTGLTIQQGQAFFVSYPLAQGKITLLDTNITGELNTSNNIFLNNTGNYIQFSDGTRQTTATQDFSGYAFTDVSNVFFDLNTFNGNLAIGGVFGVNYIQYPDGSRQYSAPTDDVNTVYNDISNTFLSPTIQKFQGSNSTLPTTAPLQFTNVSTGEYGSLFVDPNPNNDLTLYSNQSGGGLTIRNSTNSFTINPTTTNTASFLNPIVSNSSITGQSLGLNTTGADAYTIYSNTTPVNYGVVIGNTTGANGNLTISNNGGISTTLTSTSTGLSINDNISCNNITSGAIGATSLAISGTTNLNGVSNYNEDIAVNDNSFQIANTSYVNAFKTFYDTGTVAITTSSVFFDVSNTNTSFSMIWTQPNFYIGGGYYYLNSVINPSTYIIYFSGARTTFSMSISPSVNYAQGALTNINVSIPCINNQTKTIISTVKVLITPSSLTFTNTVNFISGAWYSFDLSVISNVLLRGGAP
jgi:hypothetical protein